jgi:rare lipoprotein A
MKKYLIIFTAVFLGGCQTTESGVLKKYTATSSYYWQGSKTASGERFNPHGLTAAHKRYSFGTRLRLTNPKNNQSVVVRVNDRGPFIKGRDLDVSLGAANALGFRQAGVTNLHVEVLK